MPGLGIYLRRIRKIPAAMARPAMMTGRPAKLSLIRGMTPVAISQMPVRRTPIFFMTVNLSAEAGSGYFLLQPHPSPQPEVLRRFRRQRMPRAVKTTKATIRGSSTALMDSG